MTHFQVKFPKILLFYKIIFIPFGGSSLTFFFFFLKKKKKLNSLKKKKNKWEKDLAYYV